MSDKDRYSVRAITIAGRRINVAIEFKQGRVVLTDLVVY